MPGVMRKPRRSPAFTHLVITLFGVGAGLCRFLPSLFRSRSALVAENLFLRKQLVFYREREVEPRRLTDSARICLVVWSRLFNWREAVGREAGNTDRVASQGVPAVLAMEIKRRTATATP
jgi:hypothetical protein